MDGRQRMFQSIPEAKPHAAFGSQLSQVCLEDVGTMGGKAPLPQSVTGSVHHIPALGSAPADPEAEGKRHGGSQGTHGLVGRREEIVVSRDSG